MTDREMLLKAQGLLVRAADSSLYVRSTCLTEPDEIDLSEACSELRRIEGLLMELATAISYHIDREGQERDSNA